MKNAPIRALIADDEALARKFVRRMLKDDHDVEIVGECSNGKETVAMIRKQNPDIVFLDVQIGRSTVAAEVERVRRWLEDPIVHLAIDPEFAWKQSQQPGTDTVIGAGPS